MTLDEALAMSGAGTMPRPVDLIKGVRGHETRDDDMLGNTRGKTAFDAVFDNDDARQLSLDFGGERPARLPANTPTVAPLPQGPDAGVIPASGFAFDGSPLGQAVQEPADALLAALGPDINALARQGLPLSGANTPNEQEIRSILRKILRKL